MSPRLRRLAALAAAFSPDRAATLVALVSTETAESVEYASALARSSREERLAALAAAFPAISSEATAEAGSHRLWQRLTREAVAGSAGGRAGSACRTMVRTATACDRGFAPAAPQEDAGTPRVPASAC